MVKNCRLVVCGYARVPLSKQKVVFGNLSVCHMSNALQLKRGHRSGCCFYVLRQLKICS